MRNQKTTYRKKQFIDLDHFLVIPAGEINNHSTRYLVLWCAISAQVCT